jgi:hypothetical protein
LQLVATDLEASWILTPDWRRAATGRADATVRAEAGELALLAWQRADALTEPQFTIEGDREIVRAFQAAAIQA